jgi:hypothetical protein
MRGTASPPLRDQGSGLSAGCWPSARSTTCTAGTCGRATEPKRARGSPPTSCRDPPPHRSRRSSCPWRWGKPGARFPRRGLPATEWRVPPRGGCRPTGRRGSDRRAGRRPQELQGADRTLERLGPPQGPRTALGGRPGPLAAGRRGDASPSAMERLVTGRNRDRLDLASDERLAQVLDLGDLAAWRVLYQLAAADATLRRRIAAVVGRAPLLHPGFWLAALASLGEAVDWKAHCLPRRASPERRPRGRPQLSSLIRASFSISGSGLRLVTSMRIPVPSG